MSAESRDDYFVMDPESHMMGDLSDIAYYPGVQQWWESAERMVKVWYGPQYSLQDLPHEWGAEVMLNAMDQAGIDVACALRESMMDTTGWATSMSTNGYVAAACEKYPERLVLHSNVGPVLRRGVKNAIWELEYLVKERGCKITKLYPVEDGYINDPGLWPFYEKCIELNTPVAVHTGQAYVRPQLNKYAQPILLDDVCTDFPDLKVVAFHMGWPYCEELFGLAQKHPNIYICLSGKLGWFSHSPMRGLHLIGEAIQWAGVDRIIFGVDWPANDPKKAADYIRNLKMPQELIEGWGYKEITEEDKRKILGLNLAKLTGVEPYKRVGKR